MFSHRLEDVTEGGEEKLASEFTLLSAAAAFVFARGCKGTLVLEKDIR